MIWSKIALSLYSAAAAMGCTLHHADSADRTATRPNIIFILADDMAPGDLGCFGQQLIKTPCLDQMAVEGTRFTQVYSGTSVCAPSRASLITGLHMGHCPIRDNREIPNGNGQMPLPEHTLTVAQILKSSGYATACIGKWGMGMFSTTGSPLKKGFDHFFGYNCQRHAHTYFPEYLYRDDTRFELKAGTYAQNLIEDDVLAWVRAHKDTPFFLYYAVTLPHGKYEIDDLGEYGDKPWPSTDKAYAAMVTRLDTDIGRLRSLLKELGLDQKTLLIMSAGDNGPAFDPESDISRRFGQAKNGLRGFKRSPYEGGLRQGGLVVWPGVVPAGRVCDEPWAFWDFLPTAAQLACAKLPGTYTPDGVSLVALFQGKHAPQRECFYWELHRPKPWQAVRFGNWKAILPSGGPLELYNLDTDPGEKNNVVNDHPVEKARAESLLRKCRVDDPNWPLDKTDAVRKGRGAKHQ